MFFFIIIYFFNLVFSFAQDTLQSISKINSDNSKTIENNILMSKDEKMLFDFINSTRLNYNNKELLFSSKLYEIAKDYTKYLFSNRFSDDYQFPDNNIFVKKFIGFGNGYVREVRNLILNIANFPWLNDGLKKTLAVSIYKDSILGIYYIVFLLSENDGSSYLIENENFRLSIDFFYDLPFYYNKAMLLYTLENPSSRFNFLQKDAKANSISFFQRLYSNFNLNRDLQYNYIRFTFSNSLDYYKGFHTKEFYFKDADYKKELDRIRLVYDLGSKANLTYYLHRIDEKHRYAFWMTENEFIVIRWFLGKGVFVRITDMKFPFEFLKNYYREFGLKNPLAKILFMRLFKLFLKDNNTEYLFDFLFYSIFPFKNPSLNNQIHLKIKNNNYTLKSFFNDKSIIIYQDLIRNNKFIERWIFRYEDNNLVKIDVELP